LPDALRSATEIYESALDHLLSAADPASFYAVDESGTRRRLPIDRWLAEAPPDEQILLELARGPVLDIGCGAGRHLVALMKMGVEAWGVEVSSRAAAIARSRSADVFHGSVFDLPATDHWATALLIDGNVGIGGEPRKLLARTAEVLGPGGFALVELEPPGFETRVLRLRLEGPDDVSHWFPWAWVGVQDVDASLEGTGLRLDRTWSIGERWFAKLDRP
jgi:SAM-dependent methyltransferase